MTSLRRLFVIASAAFGAMACESNDVMTYRVGVGGQHEGRAVCRRVADAAPDLLDCVVRRNSDDRPVLQGIYHLDAVDDEHTISMRFVIGLAPYTPDLAIYVSEMADAAPEQTTSAGAALLCDVLEMAGDTTAECVPEPPRAGEQGIIRIRNPAFAECDLLARVSGGLIRVMLRSTCEADPWHATYQGLGRNFERLKTWYLERDL